MLFTFSWIGMHRQKTFRLLNRDQQAIAVFRSFWGKQSETLGGRASPSFSGRIFSVFSCGARSGSVRCPGYYNRIQLPRGYRCRESSSIHSRSLSWPDSGLKRRSRMCHSTARLFDQGGIGHLTALIVIAYRPGVSCRERNHSV